MSPELIDYARTALAADAVPADHLAVTSGALDGIERALSAHLRPGDRVIVEDPGWANLLDLLAALGLSVEPVRVDDDGPLVADMARALDGGARALIVTTRAQNPTGAALSAERAAALRGLLAGRCDLLLVEDDHCAGISGAPLHTLAGSTRHWAFVRSASKAYGPDLRLAVMAGDHRTVERVHGRLRLGPGWVSHLLQDLAVSLWSDDAATRLIGAGGAAVHRKPGAAVRRARRARRHGPRAVGSQRLDPGARRDGGHHAIAQRGLGRGAGNTVPDSYRTGNPRHHRRFDGRRDRPAGRRGRRGGAQHRPSFCVNRGHVYRWCMSRTNIDIDDELAAEVMRRFGLSTKKAAVDLALRRLVGLPLTREFLLGLEGVGWQGDLDELRSEQPDQSR